MKLSYLSETLIGSEIVKLGGEIREKIRKGEKIYNFTVGDFDPKIFPIPKDLEDEIVEAYRQHYTNYPAAEGNLDLRESISTFLKEREGLDYSPADILVAGGGRPLIYSFFRAIADKGDKIIYAVPSWNNNHYAHFVGAEHIVIETNPVLEENARREGKEKRLYVMYDQMYWHLTYGNIRHYDPVSLRPAMREYVIYIDAISKVFASTGLRVGWAFGPSVIIDKMKAILTHIGAWSPMAD